jgi:hypothetical protein
MPGAGTQVLRIEDAWTAPVIDQLKGVTIIGAYFTINRSSAAAMHETRT